MLFRLAPVIDTPMKIPVVHRVEKPNGSYKRTENMKLSPGVTYDTDGDDVFEKSIKGLAKKKVMWTEAVEQRFKDEGVDYEIITCKSCGGRAAKKIAVHVVEEVKRVKT